MKRVRISGHVVAVDVKLDEYMRIFEGRYEYVEGVVIRLWPFIIRHSKVEIFLYNLLQMYFVRVPIGEALPSGLALNLPRYPNRRRDPDGSIILNGNSAQVHGATLDGVPDIVIEVVTGKSRRSDYFEKRVEYRKAGIPECWIIDLQTNTTKFYRLTDGAYVAHFDTGAGYTTPLLPRFVLDTSILWQDPLPTASGVVRIVDAMLAT